MSRNSNLRKYVTAWLGGFIFGFLVLHPFAMLFHSMTYPDFSLNIQGLHDALDPHHVPMATFFGLLAASVSVGVVFFVTSILEEKERVKLLEGLLPICSYCKKINEAPGGKDNKGKWVKIEKYIAQRSNAAFTHGVCPECYEQTVMKEINKVLSD